MSDHWKKMILADIKANRDEVQEKYWQVFLQLKDLWSQDINVSLCSSHQAQIDHPAHRAIVAMGEIAIPMIFRYWTEHPDSGWWQLTLGLITQQRPITEEHAGHYEKTREDWYEWGKKEGYVK